MFIIIELDKVLTTSSPVCFAGFLLFSSKGSDTGCDSSLGSFCSLKVYFLSRSCFWLLLLRLCSNRCAEALVAYRSSILNRLNIVHGGKILTIIIKLWSTLLANPVSVAALLRTSSFLTLSIGDSPNQTSQTFHLKNIQFPCVMSKKMEWIYKFY